MCGLAGVASLSGSLNPQAQEIAVSMAATLRHRGPDGDGAWSDERVALAHRRLAIIDVSEAGAQPMVSASGRFVVVFNGEIYNHRELGETLRGEGWRSRGTSDTEVLLAAIEAWGLDRLLERADGMFAFALYDRDQHRLVLARDRFGEKPLAYCSHGGCVYFASELRAFTEVPGLDLSLDPDATRDYFRFGHVPGTATIYRSIRRVAPATVVEFDLDHGTQHPARTYWAMPSPAEAVASRAGSGDQLGDVLSRSVRDRLVSDRPVGAFLSGGIDSSLVCALAAEHATGALKTFTMGWEDTEFDESVQAATVAKALGADHHDVRLGRSDVVAAVGRLASVMDEPFADSSQLAVLLVATQARDRVVVALSGDGGDELFAGYNRHRWLASSRSLRGLPRWVRHPSARLARRAAPALEKVLQPVPLSRRPRLVADKARKWAGVLATDSLEAAYQGLIAQDTSVGQARELPIRVLEHLDSGERDAELWGLRAADLTGYLPDDILTKVDRATMAVSLESRTPFLHAELSAIAAGMTADELIGRSGGKQPLRTLLAELVPTVDFDLPKMGFGVPIASLLRSELRMQLTEAIDSHLGRRPPVTTDWPALFAALLDGDDAPASMLWALLMFELWAELVPHEVVWR